MAKKKMTQAEIMQQGIDDEANGAAAILREHEEKAAQGPASAEAAAGETEKPDSETKPAEDETKPAKAETDSASKEKRDWVDEAYKCFVKDAKDIDPTDPVKAIEAYFRKNATDELKARCKAEGKDAKGCWKFIKAVARKALHGSSGHIDPAVVYAIAMHWFEDVPVDWDKPAPSPAAKPETKVEKDSKRTTTRPKKPAETPSEIRKEKEKAKRAQRPATPKHKSRVRQGFFFEMLETPAKEGEVQK